MKNQFNNKYPKKHKVFLIALSAIVIVLLFIVLLAARSNKVKQREQEAAKRAQEQEMEAQEQLEKDREQLMGVSESLNEIDSTVTTNTEHLAETSLIQMETEKTLTEFSESLSSDGGKPVLY